MSNKGMHTDPKSLAAFGLGDAHRSIKGGDDMKTRALSHVQRDIGRPVLFAEVNADSSVLSASLKAQRLAKRFLTYNSIRRDLRKIDAHLEKLADSSPGDLFGDPFTAGAVFFHCVILYARWFKSTHGKTMLSRGEYFASSSRQADFHDEIIRLRDKYVAHFEQDLLGGDYSYAVFDQHGGSLLQVECVWAENLLPDRQFLGQFRAIVQAVHNHIDATELPPIHSAFVDSLKEEGLIPALRKSAKSIAEIEQVHAP